MLQSTIHELKGCVLKWSRRELEGKEIHTRARIESRLIYILNRAFLRRQVPFILNLSPLCVLYSLSPSFIFIIITLWPYQHFPSQSQSSVFLTHLSSFLFCEDGFISTHYNIAPFILEFFLIPVRKKNLLHYSTTMSKISVTSVSH
jgi:hypothetical protein